MNFCKKCGSSLTLPPAPAPAPDATRSCAKCGGVLDRDARFCKFCGATLPADSEVVDLETQVGPISTSKAAPATLVAILKDGSEGQTYPLDGSSLEIGRRTGNVLLPDDPYLSPRHMRITCHEGRYFIKDLASTNGIFLRMREASRLHQNDLILIGQQVLRFEVLDEAERGLGPASQHGTLLFGTPEGRCIARLCQITTEGIVRDVYHLRTDEVIIGREGRDIAFPDDPFMSRRHARINYDESGSRAFSLEDLGSFNGTSLRFRGERELMSGDQFRVGNHLFRFEAAEGVR